MDRFQAAVSRDDVSSWFGSGGEVDRIPRTDAKSASYTEFAALAKLVIERFCEE